MDTPTTVTVICWNCSLPKEEKKFRVYKARGKTYRLKICRTCQSKKRRIREKKNGIRTIEHQKDWQREKENRSSNINVDKWIYKDSRKSDKKFGRENNLDRPFIREMISKGCLYCGDVEIRLTLDRIDNGVGHVKTNVNPACIRCNKIRGNMPYKIWIEFIPLLTKLRQNGQFNSWL
jgi:hypothetical protein